MTKIAVVFEGNIDNLTGLSNAVLNRVKHLLAMSNFIVDVYDILPSPFGLSKLVFKSSRFVNQEEVEVDGVNIHLVWHKQFLFDDILNYRLHSKPVYLDWWLYHKTYLFRNYDLVSAHAFVGAKLALMIHKSYGIPFFVTWHGSEIHSIHQTNHYQKNMTAIIMQQAANNFFVSEALRKIAKNICSGCRTEVLYNGISSLFYRYDEGLRRDLRKKFNVIGKKVVAFVGNLIPVKNVSILPEIFNRVHNELGNSVVFWIIGDGEDKETLMVALQKYKLNATLFGYKTNEEVAQMEQCVDVLVLPSKKEGLGLVLLEAIACGTNAVGSRVGGIPEIIGTDNAFPLDVNFVENISKRIIFYLEHQVKQPLSPVFSWEATANKEIFYYSQYI